MPNWLFNILSPIISVIQNAFNASMQDKQNKHNEKLVDMQNKAAEKQAEKAYIRSLPTNQMQNMRSAGISDFAAAQAISDGGTYQPAPVNTAQGQAPQIDLSGALQTLMSAQQMKQEEKMQKSLLAAQAAENKKQRDHELLLKDIDSGNQVLHDYIVDQQVRDRLALDREEFLFNKDVYEKAAPLRDKQLEQLDARIKGLNATTKQTKMQTNLLEIEKNLRKDTYNYDLLLSRSNALTTAAQGELDRLIAAERRGALLEMDSEELRMYMQYKLRCELSVMVGDAIKDKQFMSNIKENTLNLLKVIEFLAR